MHLLIARSTFTQMALKVQGTQNNSVPYHRHQLPPSSLSTKTLRADLNQVYFTTSLIINTFFASVPGVNFIREKARVCRSVAS